MRNSPFQVLWRDPFLKVALVGFFLLLLGALIGPLFIQEAQHQNTALQFSPPTPQNWIGTDFHGRDLFARLLSGLRLSLFVGAVGAGVSLVIGVAVGLIAGYFGGKTDLALMRLVDLLYSLPRLVFVIVLISALEKPTAHFLESLHLPEMLPHVRLLLLFIGLGCVEWLTMARIVRGQVLSLKESTFVQAALVLGQSHSKILTRHLLPNLSGIVIVYLTLTIPVVILEESFLSFLGLGVQAPAASLGSLISEGAQYLNPFQIQWWLVVFPAGTMALLLLMLNLIGDGLRDALDPRKKK
jgi:peptide/nickel transport system permease protein/oligopeptide transport system permease protein